MEAFFFLIYRKKLSRIHQRHDEVVDYVLRQVHPCNRRTLETRTLKNSFDNVLEGEENSL